MNKTKAAAWMACAFIMASAALASAENQTLAKKLQYIIPGREEIDRQKREIEELNVKSAKAGEASVGLAAKVNELSVQVNTLRGENDALKQDRDNLIRQAKQLMATSGRAVEIQGVSEKLDAKAKGLEDENARLATHTAEVEKELAALQEEYSKLAKDRDGMRSAVDRTKRDTEVRDLNAHIANLREERDAAVRGFDKAAKTVEQLSQRKTKLEAEREVLKDSLKNQEKSYQEAVKKNKQFEQEVRNLPKKFSEIARQNKTLIKETSEMHYNLGVFYTNNKQYERSAAEFEKAVDINPEDSYAHFNLGYIYAEYMVDRKKAVDHFRQYLRLTKTHDQDTDWARKYILTWQTYEGKEPL